MLLQDKKEIVNYLNECVLSSILIIVVNVLKINSNDINKLRSELREYNSYMKYTKNTLACLALKKTKHDNLSNILSNSVFLVFVNNNFGEISKLLNNYERQNKIKIMFYSFNDNILRNREDFNNLINLPSIDDIKFNFVYTLKKISGLKLKCVVSGIYVKLINQCFMLSDKK